MTRRRWPLILLAVLLLLPVGAFVALRLFVTPEALRPHLVAAVEAATGRRFTVGDIRLALALTPTLELRDVALANAPGGSRPEMLTVERVSVRARLLPLLSNRIEVARVELDAPDLLLETDAEGRPNWVFARPEQPQGPTPASPDAARPPPTFDIGALRIAGGRVTWRDGRSGASEVVGITSLDASLPAGGPTSLQAQLTLRGQAVTLNGTTAALAALRGPDPWPFRATLGVAGAEAQVEGTLTPDAAWAVMANAHIPDFAALRPLLPAAPPLRDVELSGRAAGRGGEVTAVSDLALRLGAADLATVRPGLALTRAEITAAALDAPMTVNLEATLNGTPVRLAGTAGTPAIALGGTAPLPLDLRAEAAGATATASGTIARPREVAGVDLALAAAIPDLAALTPLAATPLPAIRDVGVQVKVAERSPAFRAGVSLNGLIITSSVGEIWGDVALGLGERPALTGRLASRRLDLDALLASLPRSSPAVAAEGQSGGAQPSATPTPPRVIPDVPLPLAALRTFDADLTLSLAEVTAAGRPWRRIETHAVNAAGRARLAPLTAETPSGPLALELEADASADPPALRLAGRSPRLDLAAAQAAFGQPVRVSGRAELDTDLRARGADLRAVAASVSGHLGLAVLDGTVEPALTGPAFAALRQRLPVLPNLPERLPVECAALRVEAADGIARITTLLLDAPAAKVAGGGTANLRDETLALRLLHDVRAAGQTVRVRADFGGPFAAPRYGGIDVIGALDAVAGGLAGRVGGDLGALLGAFAEARQSRLEPLPECGPALTAARGGRPGPGPAPRPDATPSAPPGNPADLLRGLLGR